MSVRTRIADSLVRVAKVFGNAEPASFREGEAAAGMTPARPFSPGQPIGPYDGYSRTPRSRDFVTGQNISARPRSYERIPFGTLRGLIDSYDVAQMCIWHRIDSMRSLDWSLVPAKEEDGDVSDAIDLGMRVLAKPDHVTPFENWIAKYAYDILAFDAGTLSRMRNRLRQVVGLRVVDGTTIVPLQDYWGDPPAYPAEAYVQYANGLPWNWLTLNDLIYVPFRPRANSLYGTPPLEAILLNANTDLRFQQYFLQRFTSGNIPEGFATAPEDWTPDQIEQFQANWDAFMLGDQDIKSQIKWVPAGTKFSWSNEKEFSDQFSLFLMRKTCAAYHVVPSDLGFTENVNRSSGESQADVQHRVGDLPLVRHLQGVLTRFLQDDLHLPLRFAWDLGEEQDDRLNQAQADQIYIQNAVVSPSEIREMRYGLPEAGGKPVPRYIFSTRGGAVPINALMAVAGEIDPETAAPSPGAKLPENVFAPIQGVEPNPPTLMRPPLAEQIYGPGAAEGLESGDNADDAQDVSKDGAAAPGVTSETGIVDYDLEGRSHEGDEDETEGDAAVMKEMAAFRRFVKARSRSGRWRDFEFTHVTSGEARRLNAQGRASVRKDATGYGLSPGSGMISLDLPAGLIAPVPGGVDDHHITVVYLGSDVDDEAYAAACDRARAAATHLGPLIGTIAGIDAFEPSVGSDGKIPAFVPVDLPGVEQLRAELADLSASEHTDYHPHVTLAYLDEGDPLPPPLPPTPVRFTHLSVHRGGDVQQFPFATNQITKARETGKAGGSPKGPAPDGATWPGWQYDLDAAGYWAPIIATTIGGAINTQALAQAWAVQHQPDGQKRTTKERDAAIKALTAAAVTWLTSQHLQLAPVLTGALAGVYTDGYLIGASAARAVLDGSVMQVSDWEPGDTNTAEQLLAEQRDDAGLRALLDAARAEINLMVDSRVDGIARALAEGTIRGDSPGTIGAALRQVLADPSRAWMLALTELERASSTAARDIYQRNLVATIRWQTEPDPCPICVDNAGAGPIPIGTPFPSGDLGPPAHPRCRCWTAPG